jgi:hypothetical protein
MEIPKCVCGKPAVTDKPRLFCVSCFSAFMEQERVSINTALEEFEKEWGLPPGLRLPKVNHS